MIERLREFLGNWSLYFFELCSTKDSVMVVSQKHWKQLFTHDDDVMQINSFHYDSKY